LKKFIFKISIFSFLLITFFYAYDHVITKGLQKCDYAEFNDWNKILNGSIKSNLIISGSSKAQVQVLPNILDSILKCNSYNLALNGYSFNMQKAKFDTYVSKNNYPKVLIQVVSNKTMQKRKDLFEIDQFLPYLDNKNINKASKEYVGLMSYDYKLPLIRYIGKYYLQYVGFVSFFDLPLKYLKDSKNKGAIAHKKNWDGTFEKFVKQNPNGISYKIEKLSDLKFQSFLLELVNNNVIVFLIYPPTYWESHRYIVNRNEIINYYETNARNNDNVFFIDYSNSTLSYDKSNFYNSQHLNKKGSTIFSKILAKEINFLLKSKDENRNFFINSNSVTSNNIESIVK